jgi:methionine-rich copper-binding protein CopC
MRRRVLLAAILAGAAPAALAHSELRGSDPAEGARLARAPATLELRFNEPVQVTSVTLSDGAGGTVRVPLPADTTPRAVHRLTAPALADGAWRLEWRAISADGHPVRGTVRFAIGGGR